MKTKLIIPIILVAAALLLVRCKACNCGFQPPKAKTNSTWIKR